jgi:hypothetical protein
MRRGAGIAGGGVTGCFRRQFKALQGSRRHWANTHTPNSWGGRDLFERESGRAKDAAQAGEATEPGKSPVAVSRPGGVNRTGRKRAGSWNVEAECGPYERLHFAKPGAFGAAHFVPRWGRERSLPKVRTGHRNVGHLRAALRGVYAWAWGGVSGRRRRTT